MAPTPLTQQIAAVSDARGMVAVYMNPAELLRVLAVLRSQTHPGAHCQATVKAVQAFVVRGAAGFPSEVRNLLLDGKRDPAAESAFFRE